MNATIEQEPNGQPRSLGVPEITCYKVHPLAAPIVPGRMPRQWMDATSQHYAYRCLPMSMANVSGWELTCPLDFDVTWTGRNENASIIISAPESDLATVRAMVLSHFGHGIVTFHPGWLFRTSPGWGLWVRGAPNYGKDGMYPLDGLVETDWLPFTFTMNWRFTRPCTVHFAKGDPFCFVAPFPHALIDDVRPIEVPIAEAPEVKAAFDTWGQSRSEFNKMLREGTPEAVTQEWQRNYFQGKPQSGAAPAFHTNKRKLHAPERRAGIEREGDRHE